MAPLAARLSFLVSRIVAKHPEYRDSVEMGAPPAPAQPQASQSPGLFRQGLQAVGSGLQTFGETVDRVAPFGAAMRSGISAAQDVATSDLNRSTLSQLPQGLAAAAQAFGKQWFKDPNQAPTMGQILGRAGVDTTPSIRKKLVNGNWVPGIPDVERQQDGRGGFTSPDQGFSPSPAETFGALAQAAIPLGIPGLGAIKGMGSAARPGMMNMAEKVGTTAGKAADFAGKAADAATASKLGSRAAGAVKSGLNASSEGFKNLGAALKSRYGSQLAPDAIDQIKVMTRNGISPKAAPESIMFGPRSSASRLARAEAESPIGQAIRDKHKAFHLSVEHDERRLQHFLNGSLMLSD